MVSRGWRAFGDQLIVGAWCSTKAAPNIQLLMKDTTILCFFLVMGYNSFGRSCSNRTNPPTTMSTATTRLLEDAFRRVSRAVPSRAMPPKTGTDFVLRPRQNVPWCPGKLAGCAASSSPLLVGA